MVTITTEIDPDAAEFITNGLIAFNNERCPSIAERRRRTDDPAPIHIFARNEKDEVVGGLVGFIWDTWKWVQVNNIWVAEEYRHSGVGTLLMNTYESTGRRLGCMHSRLDTAEFQALDFYLKLGYVVYGELVGFPLGTTTYYLRKDL